jgi:RsiW-degrading membrane proteinase PrsW (M82 family)
VAGFAEATVPVDIHRAPNPKRLDGDQAQSLAPTQAPWDPATRSMGASKNAASGARVHPRWLVVAATVWALGWTVVPAAARLAWGTLAPVVAYYGLLRRWPPPNDTLRALLVNAMLLFVVPALAIGLVGHLLVGDPLEGLSATERARALLKAGEAARAEAEFERYLGKHPEDVHAHRMRVWAHFRIPTRVGKYRRRDDATIRKQYEHWSASHPPELAPIGPLALGIYYRALRDPRRALAKLDAANAPGFPGMQLERGLCLEELGRYDEAARTLRRVADAHPGEAAAISGLARSFAALGNHDELKRLFSELPGSREFAPDIYRKLLLRERRVGEYLVALWSVPRAGFVEYFLAGLTFVLWFAAIRFWDRFESEPLWIALGTVALGAAMCPLAFMVDDLRAQFFVAGLGGGIASDLIYCIVGIGLVEETAKILPVGLVRRFTRHVDEPVDWGIYGAYSALGFAVSENILYHKGLGSGTVVPRAMLSVPFHLCLTAMTGILFFEARRIGMRGVPALAVALGFSAVVHGLYDFFIIGPWEGLGIVAFGVAVLVFGVFKRSLELTLSRSPFREGTRRQTHAGGRFFLLGFFMLLMMSFAVRIGEIGATRAWGQLVLVTVLNSLGLMVLFILGSLGIPGQPTAIAPRAVRDFLQRRGWLEVD